MKTPYRYLIGIGIGVLAGTVLPESEGLTDAFALAGEMILRLGRYMLLPMLFFSLPVAVTQLRRDGKLGKLLKGAALAAVATAAGMAIIGTAVAWLTEFGRIPVITGSHVDVEIAPFWDMCRSVLETNGFRSLIGNPSFILPVLVPAFILGWHMYHDREISEPAYNLFDSLSRLIYRANRYLMLLMPAMLAVLSAHAVMQGRGIIDFVRFLPMLGTVLVLAFLIVGVLLPLILWLNCGRRAPWKTLAGLSGALLGALVSGSPLFNYGNFSLHLKENLKIPRKSAALVAPLYLMFARGGTALITAFSMLTIVQSYSSLEITLFQATWTALFAFLISFSLPATPDRGLASALVMLGALYGRGLDDGWLILAPLLPVLSLIAAFLDSAVGAVLILILNRKSGFEEEGSVPALNF